jgi:hypothetical protein
MRAAAMHTHIHVDTSVDRSCISHVDTIDPYQLPAPYTIVSISRPSAHRLALVHSNSSDLYDGLVCLLQSSDGWDSKCARVILPKGIQCAVKPVNEL